MGQGQKEMNFDITLTTCSSYQLTGQGGNEDILADW